jgi:hypothetical protein
LEVIILHLCTAALLFFAVNWIGEHSSSYGYLQLSLFVKNDEAPAFNFILKSLAPAVYIILLGTALYSCNLEKFVARLWLVGPYYFGIRLAVNLLFERGRLLSWSAYGLQCIVGSASCLLAFRYLIVPKRPLFPDLDHIGNELWVILALFLYATFNNIRVSTNRSARRKNRYLQSRYPEIKTLLWRDCRS